MSQNRDPDYPELPSGLSSILSCWVMSLLAWPAGRCRACAL